MSFFIIGENMKDAQFDRMMAIIKRREKAVKAVHPCPKCGSEQVQLFCWFEAHPRYKCRVCKHPWRGETVLTDGE